MFGRKYHIGGGSYRYGFNGQEKSTEINEAFTTAQFWEYDCRIGRRWNVEPLIGKYPNLSGYVSLGNNPVLYSDPDGKDIILLTWATKGGDVGHTAIAIQDYKTEKIKVNGKVKTIHTKLNSYTIYEMGPANSLLGEGELTRNVISSTLVHTKLTKEQILTNKNADGNSFINWDAKAPDGAIQFETNYASDSKASKVMYAKDWSDRLGYKAIGGDGKSSDNCTSYVIDVIPRENNENVNASENIELSNGKKVSSQMPTKLFESAAKLKGAKIIKDLPANLKNKSFKDAYYSPNTSGEDKKSKKIK